MRGRGSRRIGRDERSHPPVLQGFREGARTPRTEGAREGPSRLGLEGADSRVLLGDNSVVLVKHLQPFVERYVTRLTT